MTIGLMLIGMFALALINVPVAVALAVVAIAAICDRSQGPDMLPNMALVMFEGASEFPAAGGAAVHFRRRRS